MAEMGMLVHCEEKVSCYSHRSPTRTTQEPDCSGHRPCPQAHSRPDPAQSRPESPEGPGWVDEKVAEAVETSQPTVARVRTQFFEEGLQAALNRRAPNREYQRKLDGEQEARLVALACSEPPEGQARWGLRLSTGRIQAG